MAALEQVVKEGHSKEVAFSGGTAETGDQATPCRDVVSMSKLRGQGGWSGVWKMRREGQ